MSVRRTCWVLSAVAAIALIGGEACSSGSSGAAGGNPGGPDASSDTGSSGDGIACTTNADCEAKVPPTTPASCATGTCNSVQGLCTFTAKDDDGDGHLAANCASTNGVAIQTGDDCNDNDPNLYAGHPSSCPTPGDAGAGFCGGKVSCRSDGTESPCTATSTCTSTQVCSSNTCTTGCRIGGMVYLASQSDPTDACQVCSPSHSTSSWSPAPQGTPCMGDSGSGYYCDGMSCVAGCVIAGVFSASGTANPNDPCQSCEPSKSASSWTDKADGTSCGNGQVCHSGLCGTQCDIGGMVYASGQLDPSNDCESCQPGTSTVAWTDLSTGASCSSGVCSAGSCEAACFIGGFLYPAGKVDTNDSCESCQPTKSTTSWTAIAGSDGMGCATGEVCSAGKCVSDCYIGTTLYSSGQVNPSDSCQSCQPGGSTTGWTTIAGSDGKSCAAGKVCDAGQCVGSCYIGSAFYASGATNPANACQTCQPATSTTSWTDTDTASGCSAGQV
jgi:hypothetical protein